MTSDTKAPRRVLATSPFKRPDVVQPTTDGFHVGDRVTHDRCGMGRVLKVDPQFVTVAFGPDDVRRIPAGARGFSRL